MSVNRIFYIGETALQAFNVCLGVTSNNIANADTANYSRQRVDLAENLPADSQRFGFLGRGVTISQIISIRDENRLKEYQQEYSDQVDYETRQPLLSVIEGLLMPDEEVGLTAVLENYWDAWDDLANNPQTEASRQGVISAGETLANLLGEINDNLVQMRHELTANVETGVEQINEIASSIADFNAQIRYAEATGKETGGLRDQRDAALNKLSGLVGNSYFELPDGTITVNLRNGKTIVEGDQAVPLTVQTAVDGTKKVYYSGDNSEVTAYLTGGQMGAWAEVRDSVIPEFQANLDELANNIIWEVNKLHSQGVGLTPLTSVTSTYAATSTNPNIAAGDVPIGSAASGLLFSDKMETEGHFKIYVYDANGNATAHRIETSSTMSLNELAAAINQIDNMNATVANGKITISADSTYSFNFGEITSSDETTGADQTNTNLLAVLGINTFWEGEGASGIKVNDVVNGDHAKITAGYIAGVDENDVPPVNSKVGEYEAGDNRNALAIALLRSTQVSLTKTNYTLSGGATTQEVSLSLGEFLGEMVSTIGAEVSAAKTNGDFHDMLGTQLETLIENHSGVNLDEELLNLLKFQRAYQAAARIITTVDESLQTLMEI